MLGLAPPSPYLISTLTRPISSCRKDSSGSQDTPKEPSSVSLKLDVTVFFKSFHLAVHDDLVRNSPGTLIQVLKVLFDGTQLKQVKEQGVSLRFVWSPLDDGELFWLV